MPRPRERSTLLKSVPRAPGCDRARQGDRSRPDRGLVRGRGPDRAEEQDHPALGTTGNAALGAARSAHRFHLHLRGYLPRRWQGSRARPARLQHRGDDELSYYIGRETIIPTISIPGMAVWRETVFAFMQRNAERSAAYFQVPARQVVEVGTEIEI